MDAITRRQALTIALIEYSALQDRALAWATGAERDYVIGLASRWEDELRRLSLLGSAVVVSEDAVLGLHKLARRVSSAHVEGDALIEWIDAFPQAVAQMFPPSDSTFRLVGAQAPSAPRPQMQKALAA